MTTSNQRILLLWCLLAEIPHKKHFCSETHCMCKKQSLSITSLWWREQAIVCEIKEWFDFGEVGETCHAFDCASAWLNATQAAKWGFPVVNSEWQCGTISCLWMVDLLLKMSRPCWILGGDLFKRIWKAKEVCGDWCTTEDPLISSCFVGCLWRTVSFCCFLSHDIPRTPGCSEYWANCGCLAHTKKRIDAFLPAIV